MLKKDYIAMGLENDQAELLAINDFGDEDFIASNINKHYKSTQKRIGYFIKGACFIYFASLFKIFFLGFRQYIRLRSYNIVPFRQLHEYIINLTTYDLYYNILGNIIIFIPLGFFIPFIFKNKNRLLDNIVITLILATIIESLQYILIR